VWIPAIQILQMKILHASGTVEVNAKIYISAKLRLGCEFPGFCCNHVALLKYVKLNFSRQN